MKRNPNTYTVQIRLGLIVTAIAAVIGLASNCTAQTINVFKNGTSQEYQVKATYRDGIITDKGTVNNDQIDSIQIVKPGPFSADLLKKYSGTTREWQIMPSLSTAESVDDIDLRIERFRDQRTAGKAMQLVGLIVVSGSSFLQIQYAKDNAGKLPKDQKHVSAAIPVVGGGLGVIGFLVDIDAGRHLRKKH